MFFKLKLSHASFFFNVICFLFYMSCTSDKNKLRRMSRIPENRAIYLINRRCSSDHILISVVDSSRVTIHFVSKYIISLYYQYYIVIHMKRLYTSLNERMLWAAKLRR